MIVVEAEGRVSVEKLEFSVEQRNAENWLCIYIELAIFIKIGGTHKQIYNFLAKSCSNPAKRRKIIYAGIYCGVIKNKYNIELTDYGIELLEKMIKEEFNERAIG